MATLIKRKNKYSVVYYYTDDKGEKRQKWETCSTHKDALQRKAQIENEQYSGTFIVPNAQTVAEFLKDFVSLYGEQTWGVTTYDGNMALIENYINPIIGDVLMQDVNPKLVDTYYKQLRKTKPVSVRCRKASREFVSETTVIHVHRLLKCAFKQAVRWETIGKSPFDLVTVKKPKYQPRSIWTAEDIRKALDSCKNGRLYVAMNLAFACSLREGEILGLTWDNILMSDEAINADDAYVCVEKELCRCSKRAIEALDEKEIIKIFQPLMPKGLLQ